jgi:hypothetical protein
MRVIKYDLTGACSSQTQLQDVKRYGDIAPGDTSAASVMHVSTVIESGGVSYTAQEFPKVRTGYQTPTVLIKKILVWPEPHRLWHLAYAYLLRCKRQIHHA